MGDDDRSEAGPDAEQLALEATLFKAALLAGHGAAAREIARRLAAVTRGGESRGLSRASESESRGLSRASESESRGRSCLEAGASIQLTVDAPDAPGVPSLRAGVRLGRDLSRASASESRGLRDDALDALLPGGALGAARAFLSRLPAPAHASLGEWLFWSERRQSIYVDLRDPSAADAFARLYCVLDRDQRARLDRVAHLTTCARPWVLRIDPEGSAVRRVHLHWLVDRRASPSAEADAIAPGAWRHAVDVLGGLLRRPDASGRWVVATPLDGVSEPALRIGTTGWSLAPEEDDRKHRAVAAIMQRLGGPRDYAEALWSVCRGAASKEWRVGRACELRIQEDRVRARLFFTPQVQVCTTAPAGTSTSGPVMS